MCSSGQRDNHRAGPDCRGIRLGGHSLQSAEHRHLARNKIVVIESRGLRDTSGTPLIESLPSRFQGQRDHVLVDLRQRVKDGEIFAPETALEDLISLPVDLKRKENGL